MRNLDPEKVSFPNMDPSANKNYIYKSFFKLVALVDENHYFHLPLNIFIITYSQHLISFSDIQHPYDTRTLTVLYIPKIFMKNVT